MKRFIILSVVILLNILYAGWCYIFFRNKELEFEIKLLQEDTKMLLGLCDRSVRSIEQRQQNLEDIILTFHEINSKQSKLRDFNARMGVKTVSGLRWKVITGR